MQDPLELAKLAALISPQLALQHPAKAVEHAHQLWLAAEAHLACASADEAIVEAVKEAVATMGSGYLPLLELFEKYGGLTQYKKLGSFTEALRRERLVEFTPTSFHGEPELQSSFTAVQLLVQRQSDRKREQDRARKKSQIVSGK